MNRLSIIEKTNDSKRKIKQLYDSDSVLFEETLLVSNNIKYSICFVPKAEVYDVIIEDFENNFTDVDGDTLDKIVLIGDTSRFTLDGIPYQSGTIITKANITKLKYTPLDTDTNYDILLQWKAYDNRGLSSE